MKILFTGGSSFSGAWFIRELVQAGHDVTALLQKRRDEYSAVRRQRIEWIAEKSFLEEGCPYGSPRFFALLERSSFDLLCHHAAHVHDYKSADFHVLSALQNNAGDLARILCALQKAGCAKILLTGTVFEPGEGAGSENCRAVSPYGLSKGLTGEMFRYYCEREGISLGKFVIPHPFGPYEEFRYTTFLAQSWLQQEEAIVTHPEYVRDYIPISLLAKAYAAAISSLEGSYLQWNPSYWIASAAAFTEKMAGELGKRWNLPCAFRLGTQADFSEPLIRVNTEPIDVQKIGWREEDFWDMLASYYKRNYSETFLHCVTS